MIYYQIKIKIYISRTILSSKCIIWTITMNFLLIYFLFRSMIEFSSIFLGKILFFFQIYTRVKSSSTILFKWTKNILREFEKIQINSNTNIFHTKKPSKKLFFSILIYLIVDSSNKANVESENVIIFFCNIILSTKCHKIRINIYITFSKFEDKQLLLKHVSKIIRLIISVRKFCVEIECVFERFNFVESCWQFMVINLYLF